MRCAIVVLSLVITLCLSFLLASLITAKRETPFNYSVLFFLFISVSVLLLLLLATTALRTFHSDSAEYETPTSPASAGPVAIANVSGLLLKALFYLT